MAKMNLSNLTVKTLLDMTQDELLNLAKRGLNRDTMSEEEYSKAHRDNLAQITSRVVSVANKRIKQLGKSEIGKSSPAYQQAKRMSSSGLFSVRGQDWNQLQHTLKEAKQWLSYKTSTTKGWKEVRARIQEDTGAELNTTYKAKKFWESYRRLSETRGGVIGRKGGKGRLTSDRIQKMLMNTITNTRDENGRRTIDWRSSVDKIIAQADSDLENEYKIEQMEDSQDVGSSRLLDDFMDDID